MPNEATSEIGMRNAEARVYSMRELNQSTSEVIREIVEDNEPGLITRRGRIIAVIIPLAADQVESAAIGAALGEGKRRAEALGHTNPSRVRSTEDAARDLGVNLPHYGKGRRG